MLGDRVSDLRVLEGIPPGRFSKILKVGIRNDDPDLDQPSTDIFRRHFDAVICGDRGSLEPLGHILDRLDSDSIVEADSGAQVNDGNALLLRPASGRGPPG